MTNRRDFLLSKLKYIVIYFWFVIDEVKPNSNLNNNNLGGTYTKQDVTSSCQTQNPSISIDEKLGDLHFGTLQLNYYEQ